LLNNILLTVNYVQMKNLRTALLCAGITLMSLASKAQTDKPPVTEPDYNRPRLFDALPSRLTVSIDELTSLINVSSGRTASLTLSKESMVKFEGAVVSTDNGEDGRVQSSVLRSANFNGATLTLSRIINDDGSMYFTGRIISFQHGDCYELKNESGNYFFIKRNYYQMVSE
jgi:hypothetical protein